MKSRTVGEKLFLYLEGDFDGNSAWELKRIIIKACKENKGIKKVEINEKSLQTVHPFGLTQWSNFLLECPLPREVKIHFLGKKIS